MLAKTITYRDFNDVERTETFYFHLSEIDVSKLAVSRANGGYEAYLRHILTMMSAPEILEEFQKLVSMSIGVKSEDGRHFIKNDQIRDDFLQSNAYQDLFMELMTNPKAGEEFAQGIFPAGLAEKFSQARNEPRNYTTDELMAMDDEEFFDVAGDIRHMSPENLAIAMQRKNRAST